jgi:DNA mismatch repair protein MutL
LGIIRVLDSHVADRIAAGEVVERPASVVKELVENAVDAGATQVDVTAEDGGLSGLRVTDNGCGMDRDDLRLAFARHATSKIRTGKDLFHIRTLGFRGEALASIAAVSRVTCVSSDRDDGLGWRIVLEGGHEQSFAETAAPRGTDFTVRDLFFNTPARLKYMKTVQTEMSHISDYMYRLALSRPDIAFSLKHNGNVLLQTTGSGDLLQVIAAVYGRESARQMVRVEAEDPDYRLSGWIGKPELSRAGRQGMTVVVNGRYIRNFGLSKAIQEAYHTLLPIHRYPMVVLHLAMDPSLVDVNVHPAKLEVRFSKEQELYRFVETNIRNALRELTLIPEQRSKQQPVVRERVVQERMPLYDAGRPPTPDPAEQESDRPAGRRGDQAAWRPEHDGGNRADTVAGLRSGKMPDAATPVARVRESATPERGRLSEGGSARPVPRPAPAAGLRGSGTPVPQPRLPADRAVRLYEPPEGHAPTGAAPVFPELHPIGQAHGTYIVAQNEEGLYLIDQHAAHERINYERFLELFGNPAEASQELLVPLTLDFTSSEAKLIERRLGVFAQAGVMLEPFGGSSFIVRSCPHWFPKGEEREIIMEMAEWMLSEQESIDIAKLREKSAILCACRRSTKANESLSIAEMESLISRLAQCASPFTCPHGRPIIVRFTKYELEKMFKRVM